MGALHAAALSHLPSCACVPPFPARSIGCTRSKVYPANFSRPRPVNFKIYIYDLNTQLAVSGWLLWSAAHWPGRRPPHSPP